MSMVNEKETTDEVVQEVRRIKEKLAKSFDFDVDRILEDARRRQKQSRPDRSAAAGPAWCLTREEKGEDEVSSRRRAATRSS